MSKWENDKMKNRFVRYVLIVLLCGLCHTAAFAYGYNQSAQSKNWGYQPVYHSGSSAPTYQFRTTSAYINTIGESRANSLDLNNLPRRTSSSPFDWSEDDDAIGEVPDPVPVGDTPWFLMLLLAAGYVAFRSLRRREARI
jgi:hypothetical protein